ncbi:hypothetical protein LEP48_09655 [Isoptericola sp. NEAU-Y5]|uniref:Uncharacterized protein n=1 Tax=Isoptericola luteus TaxID=2879484 RepID=A0ABS7ZIH4_9MICO|nr:hypothetical protein [Isoptericola sp. NEAU-Y5]MCA5893614.1 hypothetical protein [Isoptericola sp. NEAU-Y5]
MHPDHDPSHDGHPAALGDQLYRAALRLHAGEAITSRSVDVMIEAAEILRSLTTIVPVTASALADDAFRTMEPAP